MFGLIKKFRKEIEATIAVIVYAVTELAATIKEIVVFASSRYQGTSWAF